MATVVHARQLAAADKEKQGDDEDEMDAPSTRPSTLYAGKTLRATPGLYAKVPVQPAAHPARLLTRPGMGRQMSSVVSKLDHRTAEWPISLYMLTPACTLRLTVVLARAAEQLYRRIHEQKRIGWREQQQEQRECEYEQQQCSQFSFSKSDIQRSKVPVPVSSRYSPVQHAGTRQSTGFNDGAVSSCPRETAFCAR